MNPIATYILNSIISAIADEVYAPSAPPQPTSMVFRTIPATAEKSVLIPPVLAGQITLNGESLVAAPGLQIRNERNMLVMPGTVQQKYNVRYTKDANNNVMRVWILADNEE